MTSQRLPFFVHRLLARAERVLGQAGIANEAVLLGVSGGSDSMALLEVACLLAPRLGLTLHVACIDHGLRAEAAGEAAMVRAAAQVRGAEFYHATIDPAGGDEDTLRRERHAALKELAARSGCRFILLGHTSDDQIETILFRFLRGAGLGGLAGMREVRPPLVRPLLGLQRAELRRLLEARNVAWAEDATNLSPRYARGRLRTTVLPAVEAAFGRGALEHLLDVAPRWRDDEDFLEQEAARLLAYASRRSPSGPELDLEAFATGHRALRARALRRWLGERGAGAVTSRRIAAVESWLDGNPAEAGTLDLASARLVRQRGRLRLLEARSQLQAGVEAAHVDIRPTSDDPSEDRRDEDRLAPDRDEGLLPPSEARVRFPRN